MDWEIPEERRDPQAWQAISDATLEVMRELNDRYTIKLVDLAARLGVPVEDLDEGDLVESQQLAVMTAVWKAMVEGFRRGYASAAFEVVEKAGLAIELEADKGIIDVVDRWAQRYGDEPIR